MKLTPPTNKTFTMAIFVGIIALAIGLYKGINLSLVIALVGLAILASGNIYEKI